MRCSASTPASLGGAARNYNEGTRVDCWEHVRFQNCVMPDLRPLPNGRGDPSEIFLLEHLNYIATSGKGANRAVGAKESKGGHF